MTVTEELEALGVNTERPKPRKSQAPSANGRASHVGLVLNRAGVTTRRPGDGTNQGVWVFAFLPHTARVEVVVRRDDVRQAVIRRLRNILATAGYEVAVTTHGTTHILYATKDAPDPRAANGRKPR